MKTHTCDQAFWPCLEVRFDQGYPKTRFYLARHQASSQQYCPCEPHHNVCRRLGVFRWLEILQFPFFQHQHYVLLLASSPFHFLRPIMGRTHTYPLVSLRRGMPSDAIELPPGSISYDFSCVLLCLYLSPRVGSLLELASVYYSWQCRLCSWPWLLCPSSATRPCEKLAIGPLLPQPRQVSTRNLRGPS